VIEQLTRLGRGDILVVVGGVIPAHDFDALRRAGAASVFGPGTRIPVSAQEILHTLME
jgi:methylmalonyl-CoA mutase